MEKLIFWKKYFCINPNTLTWSDCVYCNWSKICESHIEVIVTANMDYEDAEKWTLVKEQDRVIVSSFFICETKDECIEKVKQLKILYGLFNKDRF